MSFLSSFIWHVSTEAVKTEVAKPNTENLSSSHLGGKKKKVCSGNNYYLCLATWYAQRMFTYIITTFSESVLIFFTMSGLGFSPWNFG